MVEDFLDSVRQWLGSGLVVELTRNSGAIPQGVRKPGASDAGPVLCIGWVVNGQIASTLSHEVEAIGP